MMRKVAVIVVFIIGFANADIKWETDLNTAFERAEKENRLLMIYLYSPRCHYCKFMEEKVFPAKEVQEIVNKNFVPVKVRKCTDDGQFIKVHYGYMGTPMFYFVKPDGDLIKSIFGAWQKKDFLKILEYFAGGHYKRVPMTEYFME